MMPASNKEKSRLARMHVRFLCERHGETLSSIAERAYVSRKTVKALDNGINVSDCTADAILALEPRNDSPGKQTVMARAMLMEMHDGGLNWEVIAGLCGVSRRTIGRLSRGEVAVAHERVRKAIRREYALWKARNRKPTNYEIWLERQRSER